MYYRRLYNVRSKREADHDESQDERGTSGSGDGAAEGPDCEWKEHVRYSWHDMWSSGHSYHYLEAIGWVCDSTRVTRHTSNLCIRGPIFKKS